MERKILNQWFFVEKSVLGNVHLWDFLDSLLRWDMLVPGGPSWFPDQIPSVVKSKKTLWEPKNCLIWTFLSRKFKQDKTPFGFGRFQSLCSNISGMHTFKKWFCRCCVCCRNGLHIRNIRKLAWTDGQAIRFAGCSDASPCSLYLSINLFLISGYWVSTEKWHRYLSIYLSS